MSKLYLWRDPADELALGCFVIFIVLVIAAASFIGGHYLGKEACP